MRTIARRGHRAKGSTLGNRLHALLRRWSLGGYRLGKAWLDTWFGPPRRRKDQPMFPRPKLELYPLEDRYHPNDPLGMLNTQVLGVLASAGLDLSPALTHALRGDGLDTRIAVHTSGSSSAYMGPAAEEAPWDPGYLHLVDLEDRGGGAPASDPPIDLMPVGVESSDWSINSSDLWHDPFAANAPSGMGAASPSFAPTSGLSGDIINRSADFGGSPSASSGASADSAPAGAPTVMAGKDDGGTIFANALSKPGTARGPRPRYGSDPNGFTLYTLPATGNSARNLVSGPDQKLWGTWNSSGNPVYQMTTTGSITAIAGSNISSYDVTNGPDGNLWFTGQKGKGTFNLGNQGYVGKSTTSGTVTEYNLATSADPRGITLGPDGNLWFTEHDTNSIGKITTSGTITEYTIPTASSGPEDITTGVDGNLWFTENSANKIGKVTTGGSFTEYPATGGPFGITSGPDGKIWYTENSGSKIGRITTNGTITEFNTPTASSSPVDITPGPDGNLWFAENAANNLASITPYGSITEYAIPSTDVGPDGVATGPDGSIWFTEGLASVGKMTDIIGTGGHIQPSPVPDYPVDGTTIDPGQGTNVPIGELGVAPGSGNFSISHTEDCHKAGGS